MTLVSELHDLGKFRDDAERIARLVIQEYLSVNERVVRARSVPIHPQTRLMAEMEIGQRMIVKPAVARSVLHSRMKTARALMNNGAARWRLHEMGDAVEVTRTADGEFPQRDPWKNDRARFLASIPVGQSAIATCFKNRQSMSTQLKIAARKLLQNHDADWTARTTNKGVSVKRTR